MHQRILIILSFVSMVSWSDSLGGTVGFVCNGTILNTSNGGTLISFPDPGSCNSAVIASHDGFACWGSTLIGSVKDARVHFSQESECKAALASAREGFVCNGSILNGTNGGSVRIVNQAECKHAVSIARNGFTCNGSILVGSNSGMESHVFLPDEEKCEKVLTTIHDFSREKPAGNFVESPKISCEAKLSAAEEKISNLDSKVFDSTQKRSKMIHDILTEIKTGASDQAK